MAKKTKAELEAIITKLIDLVDDEQISANCADGEGVIKELRECLGRPTEHKCIFLGVSLNDVKLPPGLDPWDSDNFDVEVSYDNNGSIGSIDVSVDDVLQF